MRRVVGLENNSRYVEACGAGERSGLYFTCVNSYLTAGELAYILTNSQSRILITSLAKLDVAREAINECPDIELCIVADGPGESDRIVGLAEATAGLPATPIADETVGTAMLYSSGTTGRPKGIVRPLPEQPPSQNLPLFDFLIGLWQYREGMVYLSPAPLYHSAPQAAVNLAIGVGGTVIIMERFDAEHYLALIEKYRVTHSQLVPTMFSRLLKLPEFVNGASLGLHQSEKSEIDGIKLFAANGANLNHWWMDAGWYPCKEWWDGVGSWMPDSERFPRGVKPAPAQAGRCAGHVG